MKKIICLAYLLCAFIACQKKYTTATVIKHCTGTYLRLGDGDHRICNPSIAENFSDGASVKAHFTNITECTTDTGYYCMMLYPNKGSIIISEIKLP